MGYVLLLGACFGGLGAYYTASPFIFISGFLLSPSSYGLITLIAATGFIMGNVGTGYIVRNRSSRRIFHAGEAILLAGALGMFCIPREMVTVATVLGMTFLFSVGFGIIFPIATKEALGCYVGRAGAAAALIGFFQLGASALSSLAVVLLESQGVSSYSAMASIMFLFVICALANIHLIQRGR
jgi:DHA1 family bicyclomycin/chloramphenicol resistance-like MFS transporter